MRVMGPRGGGYLVVLERISGFDEGGRVDRDGPPATVVHMCVLVRVVQFVV